MPQLKHQLSRFLIMDAHHSILLFDPLSSLMLLIAVKHKKAETYFANLWQLEESYPYPILSVGFKSVVTLLMLM